MAEHLRPLEGEDFFEPVTIIGTGGMGNRIAEGLVRMGVSIYTPTLTLCDPDRFESKNTHNQFMFSKDVGRPKVHALHGNLTRISSSVRIKTHFETGQTLKHLAGVVFLCLDKMDDRKEIMETMLENNPNISCVIETRMDSGVGISHCFDPNSVNHQECWWMYWHSENEAQNRAGCGGFTSVVSAIFGTTTIALRQFESYVKHGHTQEYPNRIYHDFETYFTETEVWPT